MLKQIYKFVKVRYLGILFVMKLVGTKTFEILLMTVV